MSKTSIFTTITPLPQGITKQSVLETYHNHTEMIDLNPLVVERFKCKPPNYAPLDEYDFTWYTIKDKVKYLPGGLASGSVSYHAVFHDLPDGLQTHVYAPLGLDIRAKWSVGGSLPGEPKQPVELGLKIPREGLYVREDVKMRCNIMMMSFVKKTFKDSHSKLVEHLVEKAHIIESNLANERLKALREVRPGERMGHGDIFIAPPPGYQPDSGHVSVLSDGSGHSSTHSPGLSQSSTLTSQSVFPGSPPYHSTDIRVTLQPDYEHQITYHPEQQPDYEHQVAYHPEQQPATAPSLSLLPSTTYDPSSPLKSASEPRPIDYKDSSYMYNAMYSPACAELPCEGPPVPPKDKPRPVAELPG